MTRTSDPAAVLRVGPWIAVAAFSLSVTGGVIGMVWYTATVFEQEKVHNEHMEKFEAAIDSKLKDLDKHTDEIEAKISRFIVVYCSEATRAKCPDVLLP